MFKSDKFLTIAMVVVGIVGTMLTTKREDSRMAEMKEELKTELLNELKTK